MVLRDELYFEPRVVGVFGGIRWYGGTYSSDKICRHCEETVYIRIQEKNYTSTVYPVMTC